MTLRGKQIVLSDLDATITADSKDEPKLKCEDAKKDIDIKKPDKFSHSK